MSRYEVNSVEETWEVAKDLSRYLRRGDVVRLEGDLGAGKTTFVQGLAAALGASGRVASPTFCIVREHPIKTGKTLETVKRPPDAPSILVHMDLYRLRSEEDVEAIGWDDYLARGAVMVVEWPDRAGSLIPNDAFRVTFSIPRESEEKRVIAIDMPAHKVV